MKRNIIIGTDDVVQRHQYCDYFVTMYVGMWETGVYVLCIQEAQLMLPNPCDAFRDQSRSPNRVPFHMLGMAFY